jgi:hypothetical protein
LYSPFELICRRARLFWKAAEVSKVGHFKR